MKIENIRLINFRNYLDLSLELNKSINVFIGKNAQGKTNLLESIYLCALGKSFRTNNDRELINFNKDQAYVASMIDTNDYKRSIEIKLSREKTKEIKINKNLLESNRDLNSGLNVIVFSPDDLSLVKDGPFKRRDFLDTEISQIKPLYAYNLNRFKKILYQRNNILKSNRPYDEKKDLLQIFDIQMIKSGAYIVKERQEYIEKLSGASRLVHSQVTKGKEDLKLSYATNIDISEDLREIEISYLRSLKENMDKDIESRQTSVGPHRDDMKVYVNKQDLRIYGSQGQQRTAVLSIKLGEVELIKEERDSYPVLLLDDVFSELDRERRGYLIESLKKIQTIITVTDTLNLKEMENIEKTVFYVEDGLIKEAYNNL